MQTEHALSHQFRSSAAPTSSYPCLAKQAFWYAGQPQVGTAASSPIFCVLQPCAIQGACVHPIRHSQALDCQQTCYAMKPSTHCDVAGCQGADMQVM